MYKHLPPLNSLLIFEAAARLNSFKRAGETLHLTPAAIAYQVKKLEQAVGVELFTRHHKGVELNPAGQKYYRVVHDLLNELQQRTRQFKINQAKHSLNVLTLHAIAEKWLMPRLADYRMTQPAVKIGINASDNLKQNFQSDIVIGFSLQPEGEIFMREQIFPVCSADYLSKLDKPPSPDRLSDYELLFDVHWQQDWDNWLKINHTAVKLTQAHSLSFSLYSMVVDAAVNGMGIMMGHAQLIKKELSAGLLQTIFDNCEVVSGYYYFKTADPVNKNIVVNRFIEWLKRQA